MNRLILWWSLRMGKKAQQRERSMQIYKTADSIACRDVRAVCLGFRSDRWALELKGERSRVVLSEKDAEMLVDEIRDANQRQLFELFRYVKGK